MKKRYTSKKRYKRGYKRKFLKFRRKKNHPEVKYFGGYLEQPTRIFAVASRDLPANMQVAFIQTPLQGTGGNQRIGQAIYGVKIWFRFQINLGVNTYGANFRVIIFRMNEFYDGTTPIVNFWQNNVTYQGDLGNVNREVVYKVHYDRIIHLQTNWTTAGAVGKPHNVNIRINKKQMFTDNATSDWKDPRSRFYIAILATDLNLAHGAVCGSFRVFGNYYFTDL